SLPYELHGRWPYRPKGTMTASTKTTYEVVGLKQDFQTYKQTYTTYGSLSWTNQVIGQPVPGWFGMISNHTDASSDYQRTGTKVVSKGDLMAKVTIIDFPSGKTSTEYIRSWQFFNSLPGPIPTLSTSSVENQALGNFLSAAVDKQRPFTGGVFLGELKETLNMIRNPFRSLRSLFTEYLKLGLSRQKRVRRIIRTKASPKRKRALISRLVKVQADAWLELKLGVMPLISDIENAVKAYDLFVRKPRFLHAYGKAEETFSSTFTSFSETVPSLWAIDTSRVDKVFANAKYSGTFKVAIDSDRTLSAEGEIGRILGLRVSDFVPTLWELVPYSFVFDYFTNIGTILNGYHALTYQWVYVNKSLKVTSSRRVQPRLNLARMKASFGSRPCNPIVLASNASEIETYRYTRGRASLSVPWPDVNLPIKPEQWITLSELLISFKLLSSKHRDPYL
ncbi:maturation protein, partial [ssRNA phage SRR5466364_1]